MTQKNGFFVIPGAFDPVGVSEALASQALKFKELSTAVAFYLLDCHDRSLHAKGWLLIQAGDKLLLLQGNGEIHSQIGAGTGKFVADLPKGSVRTALKGFPKLRALISVGCGTVKIGTFEVFDRQRKTNTLGPVLFLSTGRGTATVLSLYPKHRHDRAFQAICKALSEPKEVETGIKALYGTLFPDEEFYVAKPKIKISKREPSIEVATDIIRTYLTVARQNEAGVIADIDTEFLHDYRIALRRVRSVLSLFKGVFSPEQTSALKREFSELMEATGRLRDLDVYLLGKDRFFKLIPSDLHLGAEVMFARFAEERTRALSGLTRQFQSVAYDRKMKDLIALFAHNKALDPGPNADRGAYDYARMLIWKRYRRLCKRARGITPETPNDAIHELRIDCKKLRYLIEFFAPLFDKRDFKTLIKPLKKLQDTLGRFNDCSVQQEALLGFVADQSNSQGRANAQLAMAVGGLVTVLNRRQKDERAHVIASFQHFDSPDTQRLFKSLFRTKEG